MGLNDVYAQIKPAIVAFFAKYSFDPEYGKPGKCPFIIGTGFIIDECGLILTNQHVIEAIPKCPRPPGKSDRDAVYPVMFLQKDNEMKTVSLEILCSFEIDSYIPLDTFFDRRPPDIAIVGVGLRGLPSCQLRNSLGGIEEGMDIATAGFPMGHMGLISSHDGMLQQLSPILQRGIIAAVQPFPAPDPISFTISVLLQGGASGSPVFNVDTGEVIGVAFERRFEPTVGQILTQNNELVKLSDNKELKAVINMPTNFSYAVPTFHVAPDLARIKDEFTAKCGDEQKTLGDFLSTARRIDIKTGSEISNIQSAGLNDVIISKAKNNSQE